MSKTVSAEAYGQLCDLFERFGHGEFDLNDDNGFMMTNPQSRAFAIRAIEIISAEGDANV